MGCALARHWLAFWLLHWLSGFGCLVGGYMADWLAGWLAIARIGVHRSPHDICGMKIYIITGFVNEKTKYVLLCAAQYAQNEVRSDR